MEHVNHLQERLHELANKLKSPEKQLEEKLDALIQKNKDLEEELKVQAAKLGRDQLGSIMQQAEQMGGFRFLAAEVQAETADQLRTMGDEIKAQATDMIAFLFAPSADKVSILCVVGSQLKDRFHAGKLIGQVAQVLGGKGGGRPDSAMAGGKDANLIPKAIEKARSLVS
jgi:alanyl-tRNA synthetase